MPLSPRISPALAHHLIQHNILGALFVVTLSTTNYQDVLAHLASHAIVGGATYDALILYSASLIGADQIVTLNERDFRRIYPALESRIVIP